MSDVHEEETYITVAGDFDEEYEKGLAKAAESRVAATAKRTRTYLTSELPVRTCASECPKRSSCKDYLSGRVKDNELCRPELRDIKKAQVAFRKGQVDPLKDDVGAIVGSMLVRAKRLLDAVNRDGDMIEVEKFSASGDRYTEYVPHPAIKEISNILKTLGADLDSYLMTPKSAKDAGPQVQVNVGISLAELNERYVKRVSRDERPDDS